MPTNRLNEETSPYLLQHADNPVHWQAWNDETLSMAQDHEKPLLISIGYSTCHWCHVMERESFEDESVARLMNEFFVCVKVDREERPDVDRTYMDACQLINGNGGWPLNAIALPDGRPVFAGTYFPTARWKQVLAYFARRFREERDALEEQADRLAEGMAQLDVLPAAASGSTDLRFEDALAGWNIWRNRIDMIYGGRQGAPKFMMPGSWSFLLHLHHHSELEGIRDIVGVTLDRMATGGIHDNAGGGFARYSTDDQWKVPHFEKMLYDNGQLLSLYARAFAIWKKPLYKRTVHHILDWLEREMTAPDGGFYAAQDADSEGEEGKYYVWTEAEFDAVVGDSPSVKDYYDITAAGNWEDGKNVLHARQTPEEYAREYGHNVRRFMSELDTAHEKLLAARSQRIAPETDTKVLTGWNALAITGLVDAARYTGSDRARSMAVHCARFLHDTMWVDGRLHRNYAGGKPAIPAFLDDHALLIEALTNLYQVTSDDMWLDWARDLMHDVLDRFSDDDDRFFYDSARADHGPGRRTREVQDNVIPSSNGVMAKNLIALGSLFGQTGWVHRAESMTIAMREAVREHASFHFTWGDALLWLTEPRYEVAIAGTDATDRLNEFAARYRPDAIVAATDDGTSIVPWLSERFDADETQIHVCREMACQLPVNTVDEALKQMSVDVLS